MNKITKGIYKLSYKIRKHSPEILFGATIVGIISIPILSAIGTMKAQDKIDEYYEEYYEVLEDGGKPDKKVLAKKVIPCYIPTAVAVGVTIAAVTGEKKISGKRAAAVMSLLVSERESKRLLVDAMKEKVGPGKTEDIIAAAKIKEHKAHINELEEFIDGSQVIDTGLGDVLFYDRETVTYFRACEDAIRKAENAINKKLTTNGIYYVPLNEFLGELNLPWMGIGEDIGWETFDKHLEIEISWTKFRGQPLGVISYKPYPLYSQLARQMFV